MAGNRKLFDQIQKLKEEGKVVIDAVDRPGIIDIDKIIQQPIEGLLYDLNLDYATLAMRSENPEDRRWISDLAAACIIRYLKDKLEENNKS